MRTPRSRHRWWLPSALILAAALGAAQTGCGTLMYPARRGPGSGRVDPEIAAMNLFWLCMGIWPGVFAFWLDAKTGALYLPAVRSPRVRHRAPVQRGPHRLRPLRRPPAPALPPPPGDPGVVVWRR